MNRLPYLLSTAFHAVGDEPSSINRSPEPLSGTVLLDNSQGKVLWPPEELSGALPLKAAEHIHGSNNMWSFITHRAQLLGVGKRLNYGICIQHHGHRFQ